MDSVFGIGLPELMLLVVLAGMVMGPERIVRYARLLGAMTARLQSVSRAFLRQLSAELDSVDSGGELRETLDELQLLRRQVAELRSEVLSITSGAAAEGKQVIRELKEVQKETQNAIMPPKLLTTPRGASPAVEPRAGAPVYRPPALFPEAVEAQPPANGAPPGPPAALPRRLDVADDPD